MHHLILGMGVGSIIFQVRRGYFFINPLINPQYVYENISDFGERTYFFCKDSIPLPPWESNGASLTCEY